MSYTHVLKSGKVVTTDANGNTTITKVQHGQRVQQQVGYHQYKPAHPQVNPSGRQVQNQFNITGAVIGQMAVGNKGPTVFKNETKHFEAGSHNVDYKISGGNFAQANIGGQATYNNNKTKVGAFAPKTGGFGGGLTLDDLVYSDMDAEKKVLGILRKGIIAEDFIAILRKGYSIDTLEKALNKNPQIRLSTMVKSMLETDDAMSEDD